jgi:hypothetical protein
VIQKITNLSIEENKQHTISAKFSIVLINMNRLINSAKRVDDFGENSLEDICEMDEDDSKGDEDSNRIPLQSSLVYNCPQTANFSPRTVREFQALRKCSVVLPSSPVQTFKRLFCDEVFNLILEQSNIYGREKCEQAGDDPLG